METVSKTIRIEGMSCGHCVKAVREALERVDGIRVHTVEIGTAVFEIDDSVADFDTVSRAVEEAGYTVIDA